MKRSRLVLMAALMGFALAGCDASTRESTDSYILPKDLLDKGCKIYHMEGKYENSIDVVYCPNAEVTTRKKVGKSAQQSVTTINGVHHG
ncbi:hypothetical protein POP15_123 [Pectobacterium phage POP15]|nr:hypothetical protein POP15_123 [Pectobacterium phage POP15]